MGSRIQQPSVDVVNAAGRPLLTNTAWDDVLMPLAAAPPGPANNPGFDVLFGTAIRAYHFSWNAVTPEELFFSAEISHQWKPGTDIYPHIHGALPAAGSGGGAENIQWDMDYLLADEEEAFAAGATTIQTTVLDVQNEPIRQHIEFSFPAITMTGYLESAIFVGRVRRLTSIGNDYQNDVAGLYLDFHYEIEKFGTENRHTPFGN